jgi:hypothetical protein
LLTKVGHECDEAEDGQQAVDLVKRSIANRCPYQVILVSKALAICEQATLAVLLVPKIYETLLCRWILKCQSW